MEISFKDILQIFRKNLVFIVLVTLIFATSSFFVTKLFIPKTYTSTVKLYVQSTVKSDSSYNDLNSFNYAKALVATYIQMLDTNSFYTSVSQEMNEKYTASELKSMIKFTSIEDTEVFEADVVCVSPTEAKSIGDAIAVVAPKTISKLNNNAKLKIVDSASIPKNPTSPSMSKNILLAALAGFLLSVIIAFIRDYFDVKIKYDEEMSTLCGLPVLGAIPDFEFFTDNKQVTAKSK